MLRTTQEQQTGLQNLHIHKHHKLTNGGITDAPLRHDQILDHKGGLKSITVHTALHPNPSPCMIDLGCCYDSQPDLKLGVLVWCLVGAGVDLIGPMYTVS